MKIYYLKNDIFFYLFSYLDKYTCSNLEYVEFDPTSVADIENTENNIILFSNLILEDVLVMIRIIEILRTLYDTINIRIVSGGAGHYVLNNEHLIAWYPEISHICVGKGENFLKSLVEDNLPEGIYYSGDFGQIKDYVVSKKYRLEERVLLTYRDNRCDWQKCLFCHHQTKNVLPVFSPQNIAEKICYYIDECGYSRFIIYDNNLAPENLRDTFRILKKNGYDKYNLDFELFGLRVDSNYRAIEEITESWQHNPISGGSWGVEFYDQNILDMYAKNSSLDQIDGALEFFNKVNIKNYVYLLLGLPLIEKEHIANLRKFVYEKAPLVEQYLVSFFLLNDSLRMYDMKEEFKIKLKRFYTLKDYFFMNAESVPAIKTRFFDFISWSDEYGSYLSREEVLAKYFTLLGHPKIYAKWELFFLKPKSGF